jgi:hypothetical protein
MTQPSVIKYFLENNKRLIRLNGKIPIDKGWTETITPTTAIYEHPGNIAWVLEKTDLVIDVDVKHESGAKSYKKLINTLYNGNENANFKDKVQELSYLKPTVQTPSGGVHIYLKIPKDKIIGLKVKKTNPDYPGLDFLSKGCSCTLPTSKNNGRLYSWNKNGTKLNCFIAPSQLLDIILVPIPKKSTETPDFWDTNGDSDSDADCLDNTPKWSADDVKLLLSKLDPSMNNDQWVKIGMALHNWSPKRGYAIWENWSKGGSNYKPGETKIRWDSFSSLDSGITIGSLIYESKTAEERSQEDFKRKINNSTKQDIEFVIMPEIMQHKFSNDAVKSLAKTIKTRIKKLTGDTLLLDTINKKINPNHPSNVAADWTDEWVYVASHNNFYNVKKGMFYSHYSFDLYVSHSIINPNSGKPMRASTYILTNKSITIADNVDYLPENKELIIETESMGTVLNTFRHRILPKPAEKHTQYGLKSIEIIKNHIRLLCSSKENEDILTQWLAWQVQFPGKKMQWTPVLQSIPGLGKTFFSNMLEICLGDHNVNVINPEQTKSTFTGWSVDACVIVLQELKIAGKRRHDILNNLKILITDRRIHVNKKGINQYNALNTANYIGFTNDKNALPLDYADRRWWINFSDVETIEDLERKSGIPEEPYYDILFDTLKSTKSEVIKWLAELPISEEFKRMKRAPMTPEKLMVIQTEEYSTEGLVEARQLIKEGGYLFSETAISSSDFFETLMYENPHLNIQSTKRHVILKKLGYMSLGPMKIHKKTRLIWARKQLSSKAVSDLFIDSQKPTRSYF